MSRSVIFFCLNALAVGASAHPNENHPVSFPLWRHAVPKVLLPDQETPEDIDIDLEDNELLSRNDLTSVTSLESYPNPLVNPSACRRRDLEKSYICDPDRVLSRTDADRIEEYLMALRRRSLHSCGGRDQPYMLAVAVLRQLPVGVDANTFAAELLDRWGLGHSECHDGAIILYSRRDQQVAVRWKRGVEPLINFKIYGGLQKEFKKNMARYPPAKALEYNVILVGQHLSGEILPQRQTPHIVVVMTIASIILLAYCACAATVISDELSKLD